MNRKMATGVVLSGVAALLVTSTAIALYFAPLRQSVTKIETPGTTGIDTVFLNVYGVPLRKKMERTYDASAAVWVISEWKKVPPGQVNEEGPVDTLGRKHGKWKYQRTNPDGQFTMTEQWYFEGRRSSEWEWNLLHE